MPSLPFSHVETLELNRSGAKIVDLVQETDLLRKVPMFAKLDASKLKLLAFTSEIVVFDNGDVIFQAGDSADCAYVIMDGAVDVVTDTGKGSVCGIHIEEKTSYLVKWRS